MSRAASPAASRAGTASPERGSRAASRDQWSYGRPTPTVKGSSGDPAAWWVAARGIDHDAVREAEGHRGVVGPLAGLQVERPTADHVIDQVRRFPERSRMMRQAGFRTPCSAPAPVRSARARPSRPGRVHRGLRASRSQRPARSRGELERTMKPRTIRAVGAGCTGRATRLVVHRPAAMLQARVRPYRHRHEWLVRRTSGASSLRGYPSGNDNPIWPHRDDRFWPHPVVVISSCAHLRSRPGDAEAEGLGAGLDDVGAREAVDDGGGEPGVGEGLAPLGERCVGGDGDRGAPGRPPAEPAARAPQVENRHPAGHPGTCGTRASGWKRGPAGRLRDLTREVIPRARQAHLRDLRHARLR